jgi:four helix bundle protein
MRLEARGVGHEESNMLFMTEYGYRSLVVWQKAKTLALDVYRLTNSENIKRDFSLVDQMRRSAVSVPSNIAEGDERPSDKDSVRFFHIAKGSLAELATQMEIARDVGYFNAAQVEPLIGQCVELGKMLGALIRARSTQSPRAPSPKPRA